MPMPMIAHGVSSESGLGTPWLPALLADSGSVTSVARASPCDL